MALMKSVEPVLLAHSLGPLLVDPFWTQDDTKQRKLYNTYPSNNFDTGTLLGSFMKRFSDSKIPTSDLLYAEIPLARIWPP